MQELIVKANKLSGTIDPPPFKSEVIRVLILYALSGVRPTDVMRKADRLSDDVIFAINAVDTAFFDLAYSPQTDRLPVGGSAALLRMLMPILLLKNGCAVFKTDDSLYRRDLSPIKTALGCSIILHGDGIIEAIGTVPEGVPIDVDASKSSQFASGFLLAGALDRNLEVRINDPVSDPYIELTLECLRRFGIIAAEDEGIYSFSGELSAPREYRFEPDGSYAANFVAANYIMNGKKDAPIEVHTEGSFLNPDLGISELLDRDKIAVKDTPDLFPLLAVCALKRDRQTVIRDTGRLRDKESDRIMSTASMLESLGGRMEVFDDHVVVHGCEGSLHGGIVRSFGDHRIVMAAAVASLMCSSPVIIRGVEAVKKSAPQFFEDFRSLGGCVYEYDRQRS